VPELYEQFVKFSKSEISHFRKLEQQRKLSKLDKALRPHYNDNQRSYPKPAHNIDSDGCELQKNWKKIFEHLYKKETQGPPIKDSISTSKEEAQWTMAAVTAEVYTQPDLCTACIMVAKSTTTPKTAPFSWNQREKWNKIPQNLHNNQHPEKLITPCNAPPPPVFTILAFTFSSTSLSNQPNPTSNILSILPLRHNQSPTTFANDTDNIPSPAP
jgi:hypothetical protein